MKQIYAVAAQPAQRIITNADMCAAKGQWTLVQVTANTAEVSMAIMRPFTTPVYKR